MMWYDMALNFEGAIEKIACVRDHTIMPSLVILLPFLFIYGLPWLGVLQFELAIYFRIIEKGIYLQISSRNEANLIPKKNSACMRMGIYACVYVMETNLYTF